MHRDLKILAIGLLFFSPCSGFSQQSCTSGMRIEGIVTDPTGAVIPQARVQAANGAKATTDATGHFTLPCIPLAAGTVAVEADGFNPATANAGTPSTNSGTVQLHFKLAIADVQTNVQVNADTNSLESDRSGGTITLNTNEVQQLADDPDDFLRQLQMLASTEGGDPSATMIRVDGFQNGSALPPKSAIASIRIAPDLFSSEYEFPPFSGGQVEIFTKPGADSFHGALFLTDSDGSFNATDPFSLTATPASKRRYGFELTGPIFPQKSSFALALEKRDIDEFNVVNATTVDTGGNPAPFRQTVSAPQRLWIASARGDWQLTPNDTAVLSFSSNVNTLGNEGVGGLVLPEAGYSNTTLEDDLRLINTWTLSASTLHETRIGYTWKRTQQTPLSTAPSLQVAGNFIGGGSPNQDLNYRERDLEIDDDAILTRGRNEWKIGAQSLAIFVHDHNPNTFNGAYVFGGGSAPALDTENRPTGETTTLTPMQQYQRALQGLPGGAPTTYQITSGTPLVALTQWRLGLYLQDTFKLTPRFTMTPGLRYAFLTTPGSYINFGPRIGFAWAADKKQTWVFHLRLGLFSNSPTNSLYATEVYRLNGERQQQLTIYSPDFESPLTPVPGSIQVSTRDQFPPSSLAEHTSFIAYFNAEHDVFHQWHVRANLFWGTDYNSVRIRNINAPMVANSVGTAPDPTAALLAPRPIAPNQNIMQYENSGHLGGGLFSISVDQHSYKRFGLYARYAHMSFKTDVGDSLASPQSSYSNAGESARVDWMSRNSMSFMGNLNLPYRLELMGQLDAGGANPYNVTTGTDNNGDGVFNDRPAYAPVSASGSGVFPTRFGLLTTNTVNGNVPRNLGTLPLKVHLDMNLSRVFTLNPRDKDHPRTLTFNARSANLLNHMNVTAVNSVLSSSNLGQPLTAEAARRIELGVRLAF